MNSKLLHQIPGTTFSNYMDRKDYDPQKNAIITLKELEEILHIFLIHMATLPHKDLGGITPAQAWKEGCIHYPPSLPFSKKELLPLLGAIAYRNITNKGIQFYELFYNSTQLMDLKLKTKGNQKVLIKYRPDDISHLYVWDEFNQDYIMVPCCTESYPEKLSLWKHKMILSQIRHNMAEIGTIRWLEARKMIEEIVSKSFFRSKKIKSRKRMARMLDIKGRVYSTIRSGAYLENDYFEVDEAESEAVLPENASIVGFKTDSNSIGSLMISDEIKDDDKKPRTKGKIAIPPPENNISFEDEYGWS